MSYTTRKPFTISGSGDHVLIPGGGGGSIILVFGIFMSMDNVTTFSFKSGVNALTGLMPGNAYSQGPTSDALFNCNPGEDFIVNMADNVSAGGTIWYGVL